jgi:thioredoxin 1
MGKGGGCTASGNGYNELGPAFAALRSEFTMTTPYADSEPARSDVDAWTGAAVLEFGQNWCGYCQGAQPVIVEAFKDYPQVKHVKIGDGKGQPLGRSFRVKLWPTLIFLQDGQEVARVVRPESDEEIRQGLAAITAS